ncbi:hypothetical protein V6Z11_D07G038200 [Gossypium hirsutum]
MIFVRDLSVNKLVKFQNLRRKEMHLISLRNFGTSWQIRNWLVEAKLWTFKLQSQNQSRCLRLSKASIKTLTFYLHMHLPLYAETIPLFEFVPKRGDFQICNVFSNASNRV